MASPRLGHLFSSSLPLLQAPSMGVLIELWKSDEHRVYRWNQPWIKISLNCIGWRCELLAESWPHVGYTLGLINSKHKIFISTEFVQTSLYNRCQAAQPLWPPHHTALSCGCHTVVLTSRILGNIGMGKHTGQHALYLSYTMSQE